MRSFIVVVICSCDDDPKRSNKTLVKDRSLISSRALFTIVELLPLYQYRRPNCRRGRTNVRGLRSPLRTYWCLLYKKIIVITFLLWFVCLYIYILYLFTTAQVNTTTIDTLNTPIHNMVGILKRNFRIKLQQQMLQQSIYYSWHYTIRTNRIAITSIFQYTHKREWRLSYAQSELLD